MYITALTLLPALAIPLHLAAQGKAKPDHHKHHHYQLIDVGTFGGPNSSFALPAPEVRVLNNSGVAVGGGDTSTPDPTCIAFNSDCYVGYGFKWQDGVAHKLDALPGLNSSITGWVSDNGLVAGVSVNTSPGIAGNVREGRLFSRQRR